MLTVKRNISIQICLSSLLALFVFNAQAERIGEGGVYSVIELSFTGPSLTPKDTPAKNIIFWSEIQHESGSPTYKIHGFWDGDGKGGMSGNVFKIRFCPTKTGRWNIVKVFSNAIELMNQHEGDTIQANPSDHPGFWIPDSESPGKRWYQRSDGSHQYIYGNTHYSFLSGYEKGGVTSGNDIAEDIRGNAHYFKKLRFGLNGDYYPNPDVKPFLDDEGDQTDWGDYSHRPNPKWFHNRVDLAVQTAYEEDLIADLILAGPDQEESRSTLRAKFNNGDPAPFLRYIAARYGCYPNVWICLCNEYDIRTPTFTEKEIAHFGQIIKQFLPYDPPLSVHATPRKLWAQEYDRLPPWYDHQIIQKKIRTLAPAADVLQQTRENPIGKGPRNKPTINDELSYEGKGDKHTEQDTIESHLGIFLGGGYGSTGEKPGNKEGQYFRGKFNPEEHSSADNLKWLREVIDENITFWKMAPDHSIFTNLYGSFRAMAWPNHEYVLGTNKKHDNITAQLPAGTWTVTRYDVINKKEKILIQNAEGKFTFNTPKGRAMLFYFKKR